MNQPTQLELGIGRELQIPSTIMIIDGTRQPEVDSVIERNPEGLEAR